MQPLADLFAVRPAAITLMLLIEITSEQIWWAVSGLGAGIIVIGAIAAAWKSVRGEFLMPLKKMIEPRREKRRKLNGLINTVDLMSLTVNSIAGELKTNGGHSIKDVVNRIDRKMERLQARARHQDETSEKPIFEMNERGHITFANCAMCDLLESDESELLHRDWISRIRNDEQRRVLNELDTAIENKFPFETVATFKLPAKPMLGAARTVDVRLRANPHVRPDGELVGFFGTVTSLK